MYKKRLIDLRNVKNLKQYEIAKQLNLSPTTYNNYENEYEIIPIKHLNILCVYFNVSIDYIFNFTNLKTYEIIKKDINKEISGKRIKEFRKKQNLKQIELAKFLNVDQSTISKYEHGKEIISTGFLYAICNKYHVSADYLLGKINND